MSGVTMSGSDYIASFKGAAVCSRPDRRFLVVSGRAPGDMLNGLLSNSPPPPLIKDREGVRRGVVAYSTLLTAKGRMITDLRILRDAEEGFILDLPDLGIDGCLAHFKKYLPPRLAKVEDRSDDFGLLTILGPEAPALLAKSVPDLGLSEMVEDFVGLEEGEEIFRSLPGGGAIRVMGSGETPGKAWNLLTSSTLVEEMRVRVEEGGAVPLTEDGMELLRIEKGRPVFGKDMDEDTIPLEAGIQGRAIDNEKGCYSGQEVIIRIRDRGQVNKELRGVLLGKASVPSAGQELFQAGREKSVGWVTSAAASPAFGQTVALGYVQRSVAPGDEVRLGGVRGPEGKVRALSDQGWILD